jgi:hypothetical protein
MMAMTAMMAMVVEKEEDNFAAKVLTRLSERHHEASCQRHPRLLPSHPTAATPASCNAPDQI